MSRCRPAIRTTRSAAIDRPTGTASVPDEKPDIIVVMSESFWDPTKLPGVNITPDPIPTVRSIRSGSMFSPEFGGMTANIEFEALTGFSNAFLPYGSIPYQQYVRHADPVSGDLPEQRGLSDAGDPPVRQLVLEPRRRLRRFRLQTIHVGGEAAADGKSAGRWPRMPRSPTRSSARPTAPRTRSSSSPYRCRTTAPTSRTAMATRPTRSRRRSANGRAIAADLRRRRLRRRRGLEAADRMGQEARSRPTIIAFFGDHLPPLGPVYVETGFMKEPVAPPQGTAGRDGARPRDAAGASGRTAAVRSAMSARSARPSSRIT